MGSGADINKILESQRVIHRILSLTGSEEDLQNLLEKIIDILMNIPWLPPVRKGAIFLYNPKLNLLEMKVSRGLPAFIRDRCSRVGIGECLCGLSAQSREIVFADCLDPRHTVRFDGMPEHGHYCIPLVHESDLIGVITFYLEHKHPYDPVEEAFLRSIGMAVADVINYTTLLNRDRKLSLAVEQAPDWVVITDRNGRIEYVNPAVEKISGFKREQIIGATPRIWKSDFHPKEFFERLWRTVLSGKSFRAVFINRGRDGDIFYVDQTITPIKDREGKVVGFVATGKDVTEQRKYQEHIYRLAFFDEGTGLPNRNAFISKGNEVLRKADRLCLVVVDIDNFKFINKAYGTATGNLILSEVASRFRELLPEGSFVARLGSDEFGIIIPGLGSEKRAAAMTRKFLRAVSEPIRAGRRSIAVTASAGISLYPFHGKTLSELLRSADVALAHAKEEGKNHLVIFDSEMTRRARESVNLTKDLLRARMGEIFSLRFQPIVSESGGVRAFEILLRWKGRRISPERFIPILEDTGAINEVSLWIIERAIDFLKRAEKLSGEGLLVSVNVSPNNLLNAKFVRRALKLLKDSGISKRWLVFEITENALIRNEEFVKENIIKLREAGVIFAIDDFGAGYTSIKYLVKYPIEIVKLDRGFLKDVVGSRNKRRLAEGLVSALCDMGVKVVAEGIENKREFELTKAMRCELWQGFYFSKPLTEKRALKLLIKSG